LVKSVVDLHGGSVVAQSDGPGRGSRFVLKLPLSSEPPANIDDRPQASCRTRLVRRVLIIEDNVNAADTLHDLLELSGHEVALAHTGAEGIACALERPPDAVLCDIGLPVLDGYAVAQTLRKEPTLATTYLVALSGYGQREDVQRARDAGFDAHLCKPADM